MLCFAHCGENQSVQFVQHLCELGIPPKKKKKKPYLVVGLTKSLPTNSLPTDMPYHAIPLR